MDEDCVFCRIVKGEIPSVKLFENGSILAFLDIMPAAKGHCLVIPKKHHSRIIGVPHDDLKEIMLCVQKIGAAQMSALGADGFNVLQSNGEAAGQVIPHVHFHVIPRRKDDKLDFSWVQNREEKEELERYCRLLKEQI
ncbi:MAG: HIT family protein [Candidatus Diapherotrites archaeon]|nr:HIT family protein [Candidatus Diapherotrites archaeon]